MKNTQFITIRRKKNAFYSIYAGSTLDKLQQQSTEKPKPISHSAKRQMGKASSLNQKTEGYLLYHSEVSQEVETTAVILAERI